RLAPASATSVERALVTPGPVVDDAGRCSVAGERVVDGAGEAALAGLGEVHGVRDPQRDDLAVAVRDRAQELAVRAGEGVVRVDELDLGPPLGERLVLAAQALGGDLVRLGVLRWREHPVDLGPRAVEDL